MHSLSCRQAPAGAIARRKREISPVVVVGRRTEGQIELKKPITIPSAAATDALQRYLEESKLEHDSLAISSDEEDELPKSKARAILDSIKVDVALHLDASSSALTDASKLLLQLETQLLENSPHDENTLVIHRNTQPFLQLDLASSAFQRGEQHENNTKSCRV